MAKKNNGGEDTEQAKSRGQQRAERRQERFDNMRDSQQRRILENNPDLPVQRPKDWTQEETDAGRRRAQEQQDNPPGGRYRHR